MGWSRPPVVVAGYAAAVCMVLASQWMLWPWAIEDSAISLAYAKSIAEGLGPVPFPGAPPTEGYSNPLWVALLVPPLWLGIEPYPAVRVLALIMTLLGVGAMAAAARPTLGSRGAMWAALGYGAFAQTNIWAQSGLENSLYSCLLAAGVWRLQVDKDRSWAALCFLGLALTRPEAMAIAPLGFLAAMIWAVPTGRVGVRLRGWVLWALVPFVTYQCLRYLTFAAELPATAYGKVDHVAQWWNFSSPTWMYIRRFAAEAGFVAWVPAMFVGLAGRGSDSTTARGLAGIASVLLAVGWTARVFGLLSDELALSFTLTVVAAMTVLGWTRGGVVAFLTTIALFNLAFSLLAGGDWMTGWRWFSLLTVPVAYGMAAFLVALADLSRRAGTVLPAIVAACFVAHQGFELYQIAEHPGVSPWFIKRRMRHYERMIDTLHLRRRPLVIDQDMGANLLWGGPIYSCRDAKGLTDLPMSLHRPRSRAIDDLLVKGEAELPTFIHLHVVTKRVIQHRPWFRKKYVEVPGYPVGDTKLHTAQYVRRDVVMGGEWKGKRRPVHYDGVEVIGWRTRAPEVADGTALFFEVALKLTRPAKGPLDLLLFARGPEGAVDSWSMPLGYELYPPTEWKVGETFVGKYQLNLENDLPDGSYTLFLAVQQGDSLRMPTKSPPAGPGRADVRLGDGMRLVSRDEMNAAAREDLDEMRAAAKKRSCFTAEKAWEDALAHRLRSIAWQDFHAPEAHQAIADCWANRAGKKANRLRDTVPDVPEGEKLTPDGYLEKAAGEILRGRTWDPNSERLLINARRVGNQLETRSRTLLEAGEEDQAFRYLELAAAVDPSRPFLMRRTERWRARRLGLEDRLGPLPP